MRTRVIPCLTLKDGGLVKTVRFRNPSYVGDPINAVRIFNDKEVDELLVLDISASMAGEPPALALLSQIVAEAFMPLGYGGGIRSVDEASAVFDLGVEKVILNTAAHAGTKAALVAALARRFGSQAVAVAIDAKSKFFGGWDSVTMSGTRGTGRDPVSAARMFVEAGAGELMITAVDRDGTRAGYDLNLIAAVTGAVNVPVIACGGAASLDDLSRATSAGAAAVAAGSLFIYHGPHRAVLINYPDRAQLERILP